MKTADDKDDLPAVDRTWIAARQSEERLKVLIDHAPTAMAMFDRDMRYLLVNRRYLQWFALPPERIIGRCARDVLGEVAWDRVRPWMERALTGEAVSHEQQLSCPEGGVRRVMEAYTPDMDDAGHVRGIMVVVTDVTSRVAAEEARDTSHQRFEGIVESAMDAIITIDAGQRIVLFNAAAETMFRCTASDSIGASIEPFIPARFRAAHADHIKRFGATGATSRGMGRLGEVYGVRADGEEFPIEASISQIDVHGEKLYTVILRDISARVAADEEIRRMNAELEARVDARTAELQEANRELESFSYTVSHDLRSPLRALSGFAQALIEDYGESLDATAREYLGHIEEATSSMSALIDGMLQLARSTRGELEVESVDLSALASRIRADLERTEPARRADWFIEEGLAALGDSRTLEAVLRALLGNAWKYSAGADPAVIRFYAERAGGHCWFCVADNGAGFDMDHAARLFQPFQRLHRQDEFPGIGVGLATAQRIISRHGGEIRAQGAPGAGALFCFTLPKQERRAA